MFLLGTSMTYEHDYCSIFSQESSNISNQEHTSDYDKCVNQFNLNKVNEVLGITSEKFDDKAAIKVHVGYKCCACDYEHTKRYTVERHMGQLHGVGRLADLRVKYEENKNKNKEQRKVKKMERLSAEIGLPSLLEESQQLKVQQEGRNGQYNRGKELFKYRNKWIETKTPYIERNKTYTSC